MYSRNLPLNTEPRYNLINGLVNAFNRIKTREHSESTNLHPDEHFTGDSFSWRNIIVSWFDLETCFKVVEDGATGKNKYDFLLVFYSTVTLAVSLTVYALQLILCPNDLMGDCDL